MASFVSIFTAEAMAILKVLNMCLKRDFNNVSIFSDSKSVLSAVTSFFHPNKSSTLILYIKDKIRILEDKGTKIQLIWVPSHLGIPGNERADLAAKEAIQTGQVSKLGIPKCNFKSLWKEKMYLSLFSHCVELIELKGASYFKLFHFPHTKPWFHEF